MKRALFLLALLASLIGGVYFLFQAIAAAAEDAFAVLLTPSAWVAVLVASVMFAASYIPSARLWRVLLRWRGVEVTPSSALRLLLRTTPAKYLPGNVAQPMGRAAGLALTGSPLSATVATLLEEAALSLAAAVLLGLAAGCLVSMSYPIHLASALPWALLASLVIAFVLLAGVATREGLRHRVNAFTPVNTPFRIVGMGAGYSVVMLIIGVSMWVAVLPMAGVGLSDWTLVLSAFLLAWTLGSLVPGAPAGLGVRDAALVWMLTPHFAESAVVIASIARLTTVLGDTLAFLAGLLMPDRRGA